MLLFVFLWAKGLNANEMRPVYGDKYTRPAIHIWCRKFACGRESIVDKERPGRHVVATTDATIEAVDAFERSDGTNVCTNLDDMLKNETQMFNI